MMTLLFSVLMSWQSALFGGHDYKMSVCEVIYRPETPGFEVKLYLYTDDITATLTGAPSTTPPGREAVSQYLLQHFNLKVNGTQQALQFYSIRQKDDQVLVQFNTSAISGTVSNIMVTDNIMTEKFGQQTNVVYAIFPGQSKKVEMLDGKKTSAYFSFSN